MSIWLTLIGVEESGIEALSPEIQEHLQAADYIFASSRFHAAIKALCKNSICESWPSPFDKLYDRLMACKAKNKQVAVLATADPQWFGVGGMLARHFRAEEMSIYPARSSFSLAAAKLGWAIDQTQCLSVHGRPVSRLRTKLITQAQLLILPKSGETPLELAHLLMEQGYDETMLHILAHLGSNQEQYFDPITVKELIKSKQIYPNFHIIGVKLPPLSPNHQQFVPPGMPDDAFHHDGTLTKRDVRVAALIRLNPFPNACLWDLGCGAGSIAVEWALLSQTGHAYAVEHRKDRMALLKENMRKFGVESAIHCFNQSIESALDELPDPDAVFVGGGLSESVIQKAFHRLRLGGVLVAHAVTLEGEASLLNYYLSAKNLGDNCQLIRHSQAFSEPITDHYAVMRPAMQVTQLILRKA